MAHHKSAKKRIRQTERRTFNNKVNKTKTRNAVSKVRRAVAEKRKDDALNLLLDAQSRLDKLAKTGAIKPNTAARTKSRLSKQVASL